MYMNLSKLREIVEDRGAWHASVREVTKSWTHAVIPPNVQGGGGGVVKFPQLKTTGLLYLISVVLPSFLMFQISF